MSELFPGWSMMVAFFAASIVLAVTPGPGVIYVVTRTLAQGRVAGLTSMAGVALGNFGNAIGAAIGLAALFAISSLAFTVVKYAGAVYLVYLGIRALRAPVARAEEAAFGSAQLRLIFRDGFVVALLNPKTTIFFAAFLPQFMNPAVPAVAQSIALGAIFVVIAAVTDSLYTLAAGAIAPFLSRMRGAGSVGRYVTATTFISLGVFAAAAGERPVK